MCGRFYFPEMRDDGLAERILQEAVRRRAALTGDGTIALGEVAPTETVAALAAGKNGEPGGYPMRWGFTRYDGKGFIINTRSETALTKPMFRQSMLERRCLIPAAHYFEWEKRGREKIRYAIRPKAEGLMFLAGIYRFEAGEKLPVMSVRNRLKQEKNNSSSGVLPRNVSYLLRRVPAKGPGRIFHAQEIRPAGAADAGGTGGDRADHDTGIASLTPGGSFCIIKNRKKMELFPVSRVIQNEKAVPVKMLPTIIKEENP